MDELTIPFLGPERAAWQYPFRSLLRAGARLAMGSDWSVSTAEPAARDGGRGQRGSPTTHRGDADPFLPDERIDARRGAGRRSRSGRAYVNHLDDETGTLEVGKLADLAVLDRDLFDRGAGPIGEARVVGTFVEGVAVHDELPRLAGIAEAEAADGRYDDAHSAPHVGMACGARGAMLSTAPQNETGRGKERPT